MSQGCRPIGRPFTVTKADRNFVEELAGKPAIERLQEVAAAASEEERALLRTGLHIGVVVDEHQAEFGRGDFLVRNVFGADQRTGAIAVGDAVERRPDACSSTSATPTPPTRTCASCSPVPTRRPRCCSPATAADSTCSGCPTTTPAWSSELLGPAPTRGGVLRRRDRPRRRAQLPPRVHGQPRALPVRLARTSDSGTRAVATADVPCSSGDGKAERLVDGRVERGDRVTTDPPRHARRFAEELERRGIDVIRGLAMDAVQKANSGHPGTPMALAPLAHVLFTRIMKYDAARAGLARPRPLRALQRATRRCSSTRCCTSPASASSSTTSSSSASGARARPATPSTRHTTGRRGHHRAARPGLRQRRRHRARRGEPARALRRRRVATTTSSRSAATATSRRA